jgi:hypothetical protein
VPFCRVGRFAAARGMIWRHSLHSALRVGKSPLF